MTIHSYTTTQNFGTGTRVLDAARGSQGKARRATEIIFSRANFPHMLSANNAPLVAGSIQVEIYSSDKYRPLERAPADLLPPVVGDWDHSRTDQAFESGARAGRAAIESL